MNPSAELFVERLVSADFAIEQWTVLGAGQNSLAIVANEEWVFRTPLHASAAESFEREVAVLRAVQGRLPVLTPNPEIVADVPGCDYRVMGYQVIAGEVLNRGQIDSLDTETLTHLGKDLGRFMNTLHGTPASQFVGSHLSDRDNRQGWSQFTHDVRQNLKPRVESVVWNRLNRRLNKSVEKIGRLKYEPKLRHGDFGSGNFLFDRQSRLSGVIDFGSAGFGDPAVDLAGLMSSTGPGEALVDPVCLAYPAIDGMIERARIYKETFALQHALLGAKSDDELAIEQGLSDYVGG